MAFKVIKRVRDFSFEIADIVDFYRHSPVSTKKGDAIVMKVDKIKNILTCQTIRKQEIFETRPEDIKIPLIAPNRLTTKDYNIIGSLALGLTSAIFGLKKNGNDAILTFKDFKVIIDGNQGFDVWVEQTVSDETEVYGAENIGYIMHYLSMKGVDVFGMLSTQYAKHRAA